MAISVNPLTYVITIPKSDLVLVQSSPTEILELNLNGFRLSLKDWEDGEQGMVMPKTHTHNTEVSLGGLTFARVIEILAPYTITFENGMYAVNLIGANSNVGDRINVNNVSVRSSNSAGLISTPLIEYASFEGGVWVDFINGYSGTTFPVGTRLRPVSNLNDAKLIDNYRGFKKLYVIGTIDVNSGLNYSDFLFQGQSQTSDKVQIMSLSNTQNAIFRGLYVSGELDGNNELHDCSIENLLYVNGYIYNCGLIGNIYLDGAKNATIDNCITVDPYNPPIINMGGSGQNLAMPNYSGIVTIQNLTGNNFVGIGLNAGQVIIDSTSVTNGTIHISGVGELIDENGINIPSGTWNGVTIINEAISKATISTAVSDEIGYEIEFAAYGGGVHLDSVDGTDSSEYPYGTPSYPCKTPQNSAIIRANRGFNRVYLYSDLTLTGIPDGVLNKIELIGVGGYRSTNLIIDNVLATECIGRNLNVTGTFKTGSTLTAYNCDIEDCINVVLTAYDSYIHSGVYYKTELKNCVLDGDIKINGSGERRFSGVGLIFEGDFTTIDMQNQICTISLDVNSGYFKVLNTIEGSLVEVNLRGGEIELDPSCIGGDFYAEGHGVLYNYSNMTIKDNHLLALDTISETVWEHDFAVALHSIETGKWEISNNQMIFYKSDNTTEIARFNLFDANNNPTMTNVVKRVRV